MPTFSRTHAHLVSAAALCALSFGAFADDTSSELDSLRQQLEEQQAQIEALASVLDTSTQSQPQQRATLGGYGELHYNNLNADDSSRNLEQIDIHRFVLFIGYQFNDWIRFNAEFETEHSLVGEGAPGELEVEQAFVEFTLSPNWLARGGVVLVPVGIINETHEPPTFYGVERNDVESIIIPATWWVGGAGVTWRNAAGWQWDLAIHEGLAIPTSGSSAFRIRSGRQKTAEATASDFAATTRLRYTGIAGVELAASVNYQDDPTQVADDGLDSAILYTAHAAINRGIFGLRALYAAWNLSGFAVESADADRQNGWYLEPSLRLTPNWGFYARYEDIDAARAQDQFSQWEAGVNFYPHAQVVVKADVRVREHDLASEAGRDFDGFDLGIGYNF